MTGLVCAVNTGNERMIRGILRRLTGKTSSKESVSKTGNSVLASYAYHDNDFQLPFTNSKKEEHAVVCGDLFNTKKLRQHLKPKPKGDDPAEAVLGLFRLKDRKAVHYLDGMFSFVLTDGEKLYAARDALGSVPLYYARQGDGWLFASELKAFPDDFRPVSEFPAGCYYHTDVGARRYFKLEGPAKTVNVSDAIELTRVLVTDAINKQLVANEDVGIYLTGTVESCIIAAIAAQKNKKVKTFSAGLEGTSDGHTARKVAEWLGTDHRHIEVSVEDILNNLQSVVATVESFDGPIVRSAVADYFALRAACDDVSILLSGDGANEIFGGYPYLRPMFSEKLTAEITSITENLHRTHLLRWNRMTSLFGIHGRAPFTDRRLVHAAFRLPASLKINEEGRAKWVLRRAFSTTLPAWVVDRPDNDDTHCVGIQNALFEYADSVFTDDDVSEHKKEGKQGLNLRTKDELLYYQVWSQHFPEEFIPLIGRTEF